MTGKTAAMPDAPAGLAVGTVLAAGWPAAGWPAGAWPAGAWPAGAVSGAVFLVVDVGAATAMPACSGVPLQHARPLPCSLPDASAAGPETVRAGTCLADPPTGLRLLCIRSGPGPLTYSGRPMVRESAGPDGWRRHQDREPM